MRPLRLFSFWLLSFILVYTFSFLAVIAWELFGYNNVFLVVGMVCPPLITLFFGWLYFKPGFAVTFYDIIKNTIVWIVLNFLAGMLMFGILKGAEPADMFSTVALFTEAANLLALLVAAYISLKRPGRFAKASPPSLVPPRPGQA